MNIICPWCSQAAKKTEDDWYRCYCFKDSRQFLSGLSFELRHEKNLVFVLLSKSCFYLKFSNYNNLCVVTELASSDTYHEQYGYIDLLEAKNLLMKFEKLKAFA